MNDVDIFNLIANTLDREYIGEIAEPSEFPTAETTRDLIDAIIKSPAICPKCGSEDLLVMYRLDDGVNHFQNVLCDKCGMSWNEQWALTAVVIP